MERDLPGSDNPHERDRILVSDRTIYAGTRRRHLVAAGARYRDRRAVFKANEWPSADSVCGHGDDLSVFQLRGTDHPVVSKGAAARVAGIDACRTRNAARNLGAFHRFGGGIYHPIPTRLCCQTPSVRRLAKTITSRWVMSL